MWNGGIPGLKIKSNHGNNGTTELRNTWKYEIHIRFSFNICSLKCQVHYETTSNEQWQFMFLKQNEIHLIHSVYGILCIWHIYVTYYKFILWPCCIFNRTLEIVRNKHVFLTFLKFIWYIKTRVTYCTYLLYVLFSQSPL